MTSPKYPSMNRPGELAAFTRDPARFPTFPPKPRLPTAATELSSAFSAAAVIDVTTVGKEELKLAAWRSVHLTQKLIELAGGEFILRIKFSGEPEKAVSNG